MTINVRFFAILKDLAGQSSLSLELTGQPTVADARVEIERQFPSLKAHLHRVSFALNLSHAGLQAVLHDGDELAIIPPVSGGADQGT